MHQDKRGSDHGISVNRRRKREDLGDIYMTPRKREMVCMPRQLERRIIVEVITAY